MHPARRSLTQGQLVIVDTDAAAAALLVACFLTYCLALLMDERDTHR